MCEQIERSTENRKLRAAGLDAVRRFRGGPLFAASGLNPFQSEPAIAESVMWWAKHVLRFQHHEGLIRVWFGEQDQLQLLISPDLLLTMDRPGGDCAIYTTLICAMLRVLGVKYEIVTLAVDPNQPHVFGHVYARAVFRDGRRMALDGSHGKYAGWEVPRAHQIRRQVWDCAGNPIQDFDRGRFRGLHGYSSRPDKPIMPQRLTLLPGGMAGFPPRSPGLMFQTFRPGLEGIRGGRRGMGQIDLGYTVPTTEGYTPPDITAVAVPASAASPWANLFGNLAQQWTQIGSRVIAPTTTVTSGPGGTQIVTPAGSSLPAGAVLAPGIAGASGSGLLLLGLGGIVIFIILATKASQRS